nr:AMP-binding protein [Mycolicibacter kumamotonensis]
MSSPDAAVSYGRRLADIAAQSPDATAMIFVTGAGAEHRVTWAQLDHRSNRVARGLTGLGISHGDIVVIGLPNSIEHVVIAFGAWKAGACVLPLRSDLPEWERGRVLDVTRPAVVVASWPDREGQRVIAARTLEDPAISTEPVPDRTPDPARAIATSGSTGVPKVICIKGSGTFSLAGTEYDSAREMGHRAGQIQLVPAPLYHTNGALITFTALLQRQVVILLEHFVAELVLSLIERYRVNTLTATTIMLQRMARCADVHRRDLNSVESLLHGGAPLPDWLARFWIDRLGAGRFYVAYGSSENAGSCLATGEELLARPGTVGRPVNSELRILDDAGGQVAPGVVGTIHFRRPGQTEPVFRYLGDTRPATTADLFTSVGDMGWVDDDGYLYLADRRVDLIISGGVNVYPAEVEAALTEHPAVADAVVVGLPDPEWGKRVHAVIELSDPAAAPSAAELRSYCRERLAAHKVPKTIEFVVALPRTAAGKIRRGDMARQRNGFNS